jgi:hypothetical protein
MCVSFELVKCICLQCRRVGLTAHGAPKREDPANFATFDDLQLLAIATDRVQVCILRFSVRMLIFRKVGHEDF